MAGWDIKKIRRWVFLGFGLWALLAFVAWHYESTCGMFLSGDCWARYWDGARHVLLLRWVSEYQTLVAGVLALAGGASAIYAAAYKQKWELIKERAKKREAAINAFSLVAAELELASHALSNYENFYGISRDREDYPFKQTPSQIAILCSVNENIGLTILERVEGFYRVMQDPHFGNTSVEKEMCRKARAILRTIRNLLNEDGTISTETLIELPNREYLELRDIFR